MKFNKKSVIWLFGIMSAMIIIVIVVFCYILPYAIAWVEGVELVRTLSNEFIFRMFIFLEIVVLVASVFGGFIDFDNKKSNRRAGE